MNDIEALAAAGCRFVRLARREKRPLGAAWQTRSTDSTGDVAAWLAASSNVGLLLGPASGVVDVEFDDDDGRATLERLGLAGKISSYSYRERAPSRRVWLEEDCDAGVLVEALRAAGEPFTISEHHLNADAWIRNLPSF